MGRNNLGSLCILLFSDSDSFRAGLRHFQCQGRVGLVQLYPTDSALPISPMTHMVRPSAGRVASWNVNTSSHSISSTHHRRRTDVPTIGFGHSSPADPTSNRSRESSVATASPPTETYQRSASSRCLGCCVTRGPCSSRLSKPSLSLEHYSAQPKSANLEVRSPLACTTRKNKDSSISFYHTDKNSKQVTCAVQVLLTEQAWLFTSS